MSEENIAKLKEQKGFFGMLKSVLLDPFEAFESLRDNASKSWLIWALLCLIIGGLVGYAVAQITSEMAMAVFEEQMAGQEGGPAMETIATFTMISTVGAAVIGPILGWVLWGSLMHIIASIFGGQGSIGKTIIVAIWAHVPFAIRNLITAAYVFTTGNIEMPSIGPAALLNNPMADMMSGNFDAAAMAEVSATDSVVYTLASAIDIFAIWRILLLIVGLSVISRLSRGKSAFIVLIIWVLGLALTIAPTILFSGGGFGPPA